MNNNPTESMAGRIEMVVSLPPWTVIAVILGIILLTSGMVGIGYTLWKANAEMTKITTGKQGE